MSTADLLGNVTPEPAMPTDETTNHFYRVAGLGGVGAFLAWLGQPVLVFLISGPQGDAGADWSSIESSRYNGALEVLIFAGIGVGLLFMVLGTWRIIGQRRLETSLAATTGQVMGLVAAVSWFLVAAESFRMYTSVGAAIPKVTDDSQLQASIIRGTALDITGALLLFVVGYTGWVAMLATAGRRAGVVRHAGRGGAGPLRTGLGSRTRRAVLDPVADGRICRDDAGSRYLVPAAVPPVTASVRG